MRPELRLLNLHFFNICRHHPTLKFKPHATDDERYVSGIDGVPLRTEDVKEADQTLQLNDTVMRLSVGESYSSSRFYIFYRF